MPGRGGDDRDPDPDPDPDRDRDRDPATPTPTPTPTPTATATATGLSTVPDQARFLAGLPVAEGSPLHPLTQTQAWRDHAAAMDLAWPRLGERLARAAAWQAATLAPRLPGDRKVIYLFGGPDAAHVVRLFPGAPAYLLAGLEAVGAVQAPETMKPESVHAAIDGLAAALHTFIEKSFFVTSQMGHDLRGKGIKGVMPILYLFLARSGAEVLDATGFEVGQGGVATDLAPGARAGRGTQGVRLHFQFPGGPVQELSYVRVDLLDEALARRPGFLAWARGFGPANGFLKSASFILHDKAFSRSRALLLESCQAILQDDSGVPYKVLRRAGFAVTCFGPYLPPRVPFQDQVQADLAEACPATAAPLDFVIGYRRASDTALQLYLRAPAATPTAAP
ncbi:MAG: hypothetical protein IPO09_20045 [Anaeromyxobacter sp.]|nr:hypothetical protein [Anaeromyxobacter sp.]